MSRWPQNPYDDESHRASMQRHWDRGETRHLDADDRPAVFKERVAEAGDVVTCSVKVFELGYLVFRVHTNTADRLGKCDVTLALAGRDPIEPE